jgi:hypothetical protein
VEARPLLLLLVPPSTPSHSGHSPLAYVPPVDRLRCRLADLYCRERSRNPVASGTLFRGCRVRKMPTDIEFSRPLLLSGADGWGSLTDRNGPWLNLHTSTRLPSEDGFCPREWAVAACVRRPVRWVFPSMRGLSTTTVYPWTLPFRVSHGVYRCQCSTVWHGHSWKNLSC